MFKIKGEDFIRVSQSEKEDPTGNVCVFDFRKEAIFGRKFCTQNFCGGGNPKGRENFFSSFFLFVFSFCVFKRP